ncbi:serine hydrolase [Rudanella lutea]|uniref:serine hydrolase n=1 Tax=Rudanella lutea TaxID=451374 RepID=UPI00039D2635
MAHLIKKTLLVSENEPYNRLYEFAGQQAINRSLWAQGYTDTRITHRFVRMSADENRHTNPVRFLSPTGQVIYAQPAAYNPDSIRAGRRDTLGRGYLDANDKLVNEPFDFSGRNKLSLRSLQQILQATLFPQSVPARQRFGLKPDDYRFMYQYLSQFPGETNYPKYDAATYYDSYAKFFFMDSLHHQLPEGVRVFNKVGWAYGFMTDVSYVVDFANKVEFMLTATIYVNRDGILNDNRYEYDAIGIPFMYQLGQTIYAYERQRPRTHRPNLDRFRVRYETRQPDSRPVIKTVDN